MISLFDEEGTEYEFELPTGSKVSDAINRALALGARITNPDNVTVNQHPAELSKTLQDGDVVAVL